MRVRRRIRLSLRWRVAIAFGLASIAVASLIGVVTWRLATTYMLDQRRQSATLQATVNARLVDASLRSGSGSLDELLSGLVVDPGSSVLLARPEGLLSSGRAVETRTSRPLCSRPTRGAGVGRHRHRRDTGAGNFARGRIPRHSVHPAVPAGGAGEDSALLLVVLIGGAAASGLLGVGLGWWTGKRALRPLTELTASAARFASGDLQVRLPDQGDPDLDPLASTFNATVEALERRVRLDARFAGDISHELRSPLTTMVNAVEVLRHRKSAMPLAAGQAVDLLGGEVERFQKTLLDLLEISRADQDVDDRAMESIDLAVLVSKVSETTTARRPGGGEAPTARLRRSPPVGAGRGEPLDNAARHGGGVIKVTVTERQGMARLEVDDNGPGVPAELRTQIFERFARGRHAGERGDESGSGLGLALVARHVRLHSGAVWVEDRPGGGARFVVELPAAPSPIGSTRPTAPDRGTHQQGLRAERPPPTSRTSSRSHWLRR